MSHAVFTNWRNRREEAFPFCSLCGSPFRLPTSPCRHVTTSLPLRMFTFPSQVLDLTFLTLCFCSVTSFRAANVLIGATISRRAWKSNSVVPFSQSTNMHQTRDTTIREANVPHRETNLWRDGTSNRGCLHSIDFSFCPLSTPRGSVVKAALQENTAVYIKTHCRSVPFPVSHLDQASTLNPQPNHHSTFHHQRPVFTTCLHFFTYSHTPFRTSASPRPTFQTVRLFCHLSIWKFLCHLCRCHLSFLQNVAFPVASTCNGQLRPFPFHSRSHASLVKCISG